MDVDAQITRQPSDAGMPEANAWPLLTFADDGVIAGPWAGGGGLHNFLEAQGWQHSLPTDTDLADGDHLDRDVAGTSPCSACGAVGGRYESFRGRADEHLSVAVCGACGHASTF
jgi:hypothetical protein